MHIRISLFLVMALLCLSLQGAEIFSESDIPREASNDAIMSSSGDVQTLHDWTSLAFTGVDAQGAKPKINITVRRQDHCVLQFGRSCIETPLKIGTNNFKHGLGTHTQSEIEVSVPAGVSTFRSRVGVDNNNNTQGRLGSVQFSIEINGKSVASSPILKGGDEPFELAVAIPEGTQKLVLKANPTADGVPHDHADWAEAHFVTSTGEIIWIDEGNQNLLTLALPFSFRYGGTEAKDLLPKWEKSFKKTTLPSRFKYEVTWKDPQTKLSIVAIVSIFKHYPATEWVLYFKNEGSQDTPILENIEPLDIQLRTGYEKNPLTLHQLTGDWCNERSFLPVETVIEAGNGLTFAPKGGRSSNGAFPFFNVAYAQEGLICAIGWSGQWAAKVQRSATGPSRLLAGMELTHLKLHPGEQIRTPRILLSPWKGDRQTAHNRFRRLLLFEYVPKQNGRPIRMPVALQCYDRYINNRPDWGTESRQIEAARAAAKLGCDAHWLDAAWFEGGFPNGVGNLTPKPDAFPRGLKPISDVCHQLGMKFIVWFEPERIGAGSTTAREHPEFVFGGSKGGLFKLNDPTARRWLTDVLSQRITEFGLDIYRNDFNIDPLPFWRANDSPDRQGITEIRYVEGHYAMWDELLARHPGLAIDNCSSGGRRIDLETCMRSIPLWRSDTGCSPDHADWNQTQTYGLSQYIPLFSTSTWIPEAYEIRSAATAGCISQWDILNPSFPWPKGQTLLKEAKSNQKYWYGDFYPLTPCLGSSGNWIGYQWHRPDLNAGIALIFRRSNSPYTALSLELKALHVEKIYSVECVDDNLVSTKQQLSGRELMSNFELRIPKKSGSVLVKYD